MSPANGLSERERSLYELLSNSQVHVDTLSNRLGIAAGEVSSMLMIMELSGFAQRLAGDNYVRQNPKQSERLAAFDTRTLGKLLRQGNTEIQLQKSLTSFKQGFTVSAEIFAEIHCHILVLRLIGRDGERIHYLRLVFDLVLSMMLSC